MKRKGKLRSRSVEYQRGYRAGYAAAKKRCSGPVEPAPESPVSPYWDQQRPVITGGLNMERGPYDT